MDIQHSVVGGAEGLVPPSRVSYAELTSLCLELATAQGPSGVQGEMGSGAGLREVRRDFAVLGALCGPHLILFLLCGIRESSDILPSEWGWAAPGHVLQALP